MKNSRRITARVYDSSALRMVGQHRRERDMVLSRSGFNIVPMESGSWTINRWFEQEFYVCCVPFAKCVHNVVLMIRSIPEHNHYRNWVWSVLCQHPPCTAPGFNTADALVHKCED